MTKFMTLSFSEQIKPMYSISIAKPLSISMNSNWGVYIHSSCLVETESIIKLLSGIYGINVDKSSLYDTMTVITAKSGYSIRVNDGALLIYDCSLITLS